MLGFSYVGSASGSSMVLSAINTSFDSGIFASETLAFSAARISLHKRRLSVGGRLIISIFSSWFFILFSRSH